MTQSQFVLSKFFNKRCEFQFRNLVQATGVICTFIYSEPMKFYFLPTDKMVEFKEPMEANDEQVMKKMLVPIDVNDIISGKILNW